ncbi:MAG: hypothetical protein IBX56_17270 [Methylomicrobium sp.]|nr:hypothetical protein [Methylomicrobium sp.]
MSVAVVLDETCAEQTKAFEKIWRGFWHAVNVLQFSPRFTVATRGGVSEQVFENLLQGWPLKPHEVQSVSSAASDNPWSEIFDLCEIDRFALEALMNAGIACPEVGFDLVANTQVVATAELAWPDALIAVMLEPPETLVEISGWKLLSIHQSGWLDELMQLLPKQE